MLALVGSRSWPSFLGRYRKLALPCATRRRAAKAKRWCPSRLRTPYARRRPPRLPAAARSPSATRLANPLPAIFFSAPPEAPHHPAHARLAHRETGHPSEVLATLGEGGGGAFFEVRFQQPTGALVHLGLGSRTLLWGEGAS